MRQDNLDDTIVAISTPIGEAGIGIVRISGKKALKIADKIFVSKDGKRPSEFKTYTTHYGWIVSSPQSTMSISPQKIDEKLSTNIIDEVILTVMCAPKSYTKEDIVEINCHGGIVALRRVLDLVLENGCRLADPGEFTKRAFLNGRIDLAQAEAVLDIIQAKTDSALKMGLEQLRGALSKEIYRIRNILLSQLSILEADINFPDEEIGSPELDKIQDRLANVDAQLKSILNGARFGRVFREGIKVVICGRPNVGKSSLLNALLKQERSIVTPIAGTTRDTVEEVIDIKGIPIKIVDTAGIIKPGDPIERKAVQRSKRYIELADLVILIFDGSTGLTKEDEILMNKLKKKVVLATINKIDLKQKVEREKIRKMFNCLIDISAKKNKNINLLEDAIAKLVYKGKVSSCESILVSNLRHIEKMRRAQKLVAEAANSLDNKLSFELVCQDIRDALLYLDEIVGKRFSDDLLDKIFSVFCIGK